MPGRHLEASNDVLAPLTRSSKRMEPVVAFATDKFHSAGKSTSYLNPSQTTSFVTCCNDIVYFLPEELMTAFAMFACGSTLLGMTLIKNLNIQHDQGTVL